MKLIVVTSKYAKNFVGRSTRLSRSGANAGDAADCPIRAAPPIPSNFRHSMVITARRSSGPHPDAASVQHPSHFAVLKGRFLRENSEAKEFYSNYCLIIDLINLEWELVDYKYITLQH